MGSNELNDPPTWCLKTPKLVECKKFALSLQLLVLKVKGRRKKNLPRPLLDFMNDALPSPLLDPKGVQLCQIVEVVWDLEPLPASSIKGG
jgi:hypothetical protein